MRIRAIKPEFFTHEALFEAEKEHGLPLRVAFSGLWCAADREGRFKWEPRRLGVNILPYDDIEFSHVLEALSESGFIVRYGNDGQYGFIPSFLSHQHVNVREAKSSIPEFDGKTSHVHARESTGNAQHIPKGVNIPGPLRETVYARDGRKCVRCSAVEDLTVDHIFPRGIGGTHALSNLRTLCRPCNSGRPVQGNGLIEDLARDGFSLSDMQRICMHVQDSDENINARGERKGKEGKGKEGNDASPPLSDSSENIETKPDAVPAKTKRLDSAKAILARLNELSGRAFRETEPNLTVIAARLEEPGVDSEGVLQMLGRQWANWKGGKMEEYFRPETLFGKTKFDSYYASKDLAPQSKSEPAPPWVEKQQLEDAIAEHPANLYWIGYKADRVTDAMRNDLKAKRARLKELQ